MKYSLAIIFLLISLVSTSIDALGQDNPMFSRPKKDTTQTIAVEKSPINTETSTQTETIPSKGISYYYHKLSRKNSQWQMQLRTKIVRLAKQMEQEGKAKSYLWILLISFLYGIAHSLGPGHNKLLIFSYFLGEKANIKEGIILGNITAFIHALSGLVVSLFIIYIIKATTTAAFDQSAASVYITKISFGMITLIGIGLLIGHIRQFIKPKKEQANLPIKRILPMALALGIVPCPGTMILVSFLSIAGLQTFALWAALSMGAGMAVTISLIGLLTIVSKNVIFKSFGQEHKSIQNVQFGLAIFGSLLIISMGIFFVL
jgi:ABC-type nickel/cobalt efflux system permease component RcnA